MLGGPRPASLAFVDINIVAILISFLVLLFSLTVHECAHAWAADRLGDPTARALGRVTLNPLPHLDWIGTVLFPLAGMISGVPLIGWAKPVPVATWRFDRPRRDYLMVAAAGPVSNLAIAFVSSVVLRALLSFEDSGPTSANGILVPLRLLADAAFSTNLLLAIFNLLPIPPLDGSSVLAGLLPERLAAVLDRLRPYGFVLLYALMLSGGFSLVVGTPYFYLRSWLRL
jgi:Zn-dependent protease